VSTPMIGCLGTALTVYSLSSTTSEDNTGEFTMVDVAWVLLRESVRGAGLISMEVPNALILLYSTIAALPNHYEFFRRYWDFYQRDGNNSLLEGALVTVTNTTLSYDNLW